MSCVSLGVELAACDIFVLLAARHHISANCDRVSDTHHNIECGLRKTLLTISPVPGRVAGVTGNVCLLFNVWSTKSIAAPLWFALSKA